MSISKPTFNFHRAVLLTVVLLPGCNTKTPNGRSSLTVGSKVEWNKMNPVSSPKPGTIIGDGACQVAPGLRIKSAEVEFVPVGKPPIKGTAQVNLVSGNIHSVTVATYKALPGIRHTVRARVRLEAASGQEEVLEFSEKEITPK